MFYSTYMYVDSMIMHGLNHVSRFYVNLNLRNFTAIKNGTCGIFSRAPYRVLLCIPRSGVRE